MSNNLGPVKVYRSNLPFYMGYTLFLFSNLFSGIDVVNNYHVLFSIFGTALVLTGIITNFDSFKKAFVSSKFFALYILLSIISVASFFVTRNFAMIRLMVILAGLMTVNIKDLIRYDFSVRSLAVTAIVLLAIIGILPNNIIERSGDFVRYSLGFSHPNVLGVNVMMIILELNYLFKEKILLLLSINVCAMIFEYAVPNSRITVVILLFVSLYLLFSKRINKIFAGRVLKRVVCLSFVILTVMTVLSVFAYKEHLPATNFVNRFTSNRLYLYGQAIDTAGISVLGTRPEKNVHQTVVLDNAYLELLLTFGILQYLCFAIISFLSYKELFRVKKYHIIFLLFVMSIYGLMETSFIYVSTNIFLLFFVLAFRRERRGEDL